MKSRLLWLAIVALGATALYFRLVQPHVSTIPSEIRDATADLKPAAPPPLEPPVLEVPPLPEIKPPSLVQPAARMDPIPPKPEVPIQNNATIDFSTGSPIVKTHGKDKEALDAAIREIEEAAKNTRFETQDATVPKKSP